MLLVDTVEKVIIGDEKLKLGIAHSRPHADWLKQLVTLEDLKQSCPPQDEESPDLSSLRINGSAAMKTNGYDSCNGSEDLRKLLSLFNYTLETLTLLLVPMFTTK